jgi:hypothetical protein
MALSNCIIPIQARLDELTPYGYTQQPVGALEALLSPANPSKIAVKYLRDDGKFKKYQVTYVPPDCTPPTDCSSTPGDICGSGTSKPVTPAEFTIGDCLFSGVIELTINQFRDLCNFNPAQFTIAQIQGKMDTFRRAINQKVLTDICGYVGGFSAAQTGAKILPLINPTTGAPNFLAETDVLSDFSDAGMAVSPIIIGGRSWKAYRKAVKTGGVRADGVNVGEFDDFNAFYDNQLQSVCGTANYETSIAIAPSLISLNNFLENVGDFQANAKIDQNNVLSFLTEGDEYHYGIIQDPITKMYYDFNAIFDKCTKTWKLSFKTTFDTWKMPITQCYYNGWTGIVKYNVCPYTLACPA